MVNSKKDFEKYANSGGCSEPCRKRLPCGHACEKGCHIIDVDHLKTIMQCQKQCIQRMSCPQQHQCTQNCHYGKECGDCKVKVKKLRPDCQHIVEVDCSIDMATGNLGRMACTEKIESITFCGHKVQVECCDKNDIVKKLDACSVPCGIELQCGHLCGGSCGQCKLGRLHIL